MQATGLLKKELRKELLEIRRNIKGEEKRMLDTAICEIFLSTEVYKRAETVFMYATLGSEIDVTTIAEQALIDGKKVAFPISNTEDFSLTFRVVSSLNELQKGAYSICEPPHKNPIVCSDEGTVCLVPALGFNPMRYRIGYGKGYYDRFLKDFCGISVGLVYKRLISDKIIIGKYDLPCDILICEEGVVSSEY